MNWCHYLLLLFLLVSCASAAETNTTSKDDLSVTHPELQATIFFPDVISLKLLIYPSGKSLNSTLREDTLLQLVQTQLYRHIPIELEQAGVATKLRVVTIAVDGVFSSQDIPQPKNKDGTQPSPLPLVTATFANISLRLLFRSGEDVLGAQEWDNSLKTGALQRSFQSNAFDSFILHMVSSPMSNGLDQTLRVQALWKHSSKSETWQVLDKADVLDVLKEIGRAHV